MPTHHLRANLWMLTAALLWGGSFVVQRLSIGTIGPMLYTGLRFLLGAVVIAIIGIWLKPVARATSFARRAWLPGCLLGAIVAVSVSAQQIGLGYTPIANAGFISSMYVVIVPVLSVLAGQRVRLGIALGAACAAVGLFYLSGEHASLSYGDGLELFGAAVISLHMILVGAFTQRYHPLHLALVQCVACGVLCVLVAVLLEPIRIAEVQQSAFTLFYGGALSVGVGYAIQLLAQRDAVPSHVAIILSMEGVFAAVAGWLVLGQTLSWHAIGGCALVVVGCILSQLMPARRSGA